MPGFSTSLAYYDTYRRENVPANLIQVASPACLSVQPPSGLVGHASELIS